jgi:alpha-L-rhamnosidase
MIQMTMHRIVIGSCWKRGVMTDTGLAVANLRTNYLINPIGIGDRWPCCSWEVVSDRRDVTQRAFQILAGSSREAVIRGLGDHWDSGWVASHETNQIPYAGQPVRARERVWWAVRSEDLEGNRSAWSEPVFWETGLLPDTDVIGTTASERSVWEARWIELQGLVADSELPVAQVWDGLVPVPHFRRVFRPAGKVGCARLYVTARGVYEASLNGDRVGDHTLDPGWTDYHRRITYQTFDVTDMIHDGENVLGAQVAPGWYAGYVAFGPQCRHYGTTPQLLMQLHLELEDGSEEVIATGEGWRASTGARRYGDLLFGEYIDARRHPDGWDQPGFDDREWRDAAVTAIGSVPIVASVSEPVRALDELAPVALAEQTPGVWIVDLGRNIAGRIRLRARGAAGTVIRLRHGERLNGDPAAAW